MSRDDFSAATIRVLERRVAGLCSNPECRQPTTGPGDGPSGVVNVGTAAHITAAAEGGPRYDVSLTSEQRASIDNGVWLCARCARLVDGSPARFTTELLHQWKMEAESRASYAVQAGGGASESAPIALLERVLEGHKNYVWDVLVTEDGRRVVSASNDRTIRLWDVHSGAQLCQFGPHSSQVMSLALAPGDTHVAAGQFDGTVDVWELATEARMLQLHHGAPDAKVAYASSTSMVTGGADGVLRFWLKPAGSSDGAIIAHEGAVLKVAVAEDVLVSVSADRTIAVWDLVSRRLRRRMTGHTGEVNSAAISCHHDRLLTASEDHSVKLWEISSGRCLATLHGHTDVVWRVALSRDCRQAASGSGDNCVFLWDLEALQCIKRLEHPDCVAAVAFSPVEHRLTVGCDDHRVYVYRLWPPF